MALQALLFDLDGTLIDTNLLPTDAFYHAFEQNGYRVAPLKSAKAAIG